jgi:hypothetical protein
MTSWLKVQQARLGMFLHASHIAPPQPTMMQEHAEWLVKAISRVQKGGGLGLTLESQPGTYGLTGPPCSSCAFVLTSSVPGFCEQGDAEGKE